MTRSPDARQRGAASLFMLVALAFGGALMLQVGRLGAHAVADARAETAADAAALAAADFLALGKGAPAARQAAIRTAAANGAELTPADCDCSGRVVTVNVTVRFRPLGLVATDAKAKASAEIRPVLDMIAR